MKKTIPTRMSRRTYLSLLQKVKARGIAMRAAGDPRASDFEEAAASGYEYLDRNPPRPRIRRASA